MKWEIFWEIPDCPPFLTAEPARFFTRQMKQFCDENFSDCILEYRNNTNFWYLDAHEWSKRDAHLFERMRKNPRWGTIVNTIAQKACGACLDYLDTVGLQDFSNMSDKKLYQTYRTFYRTYIPAHASGHPANVLEIKNQRLSKYLTRYLQQRIWTTDYPLEASAAFTLLITPTRDMSPQREAKSFFRVGALIKKNKAAQKLFLSSDVEILKQLLPKKFPTLWRAVTTHHHNFCWTGYNWEGPAYSLEYYLDSWKSALRQQQNFTSARQNLVAESRSIAKQQQVLLRKLDVDERHRLLIRIASDIMYFKALRKDCMYKGAWASEPLFTEIGRRLGFSTHEARYIFFFEMEDALVHRVYSKTLIKSRTREVVLHQRSTKPDIILHGAQARTFIRSLRVAPPDKTVRELRGQCAYPGTIRGRVKIVNTPDAMHKMQKGDILVAYATQPNLLPAMRQAAAFVTDFGGITCHAAIVAREWKVPCVIGTGNATKILTDGELVEIDASKGIVTRIK